MTIQELGERCCIPVEKLKLYESCGLLPEKRGGEKEYTDEDLERLGLVCTLTKAGFTCGEIKQYISYPKGKEGKEQQILMLKRQRGKLLETLHQKQQILDKIDYMILKKRKEE